jgi:hypothetical protein
MAGCGRRRCGDGSLETKTDGDVQVVTDLGIVNRGIHRDVFGM